jgi:DNA polymerase III subunit beta
MKMRIKRADFVRYGGLAEKVTGKNTPLPVLSNILLDAKGKMCTITATNLDIGIETTISAEVYEEGITAVPGALLFSFLSGFSSGVVDIHSEGNILFVDIGGNIAKINTFPFEDFPALPRPVASTAFQFDTEDLLNGIRSVWYASSNSVVKPELASIFMKTEGNTIFFVATDSFRLAEKSLILKKAPDIPHLLIPSRNIPDIVRVLEDVGGVVVFECSENQLGISCGNVYVTSRLVNGSFPDYRQIVPKEFVSEVTLLRQDLLGALKTTGLFTNKFQQLRIYVEPNKKKLSFYAKNDEVGEVTETPSATLSGEALEISFNQKYLQDALQSVSSDSVSLSFAGPGRPMVLRGVSDSSLLYLSMPMNR